MHIEFQNGAAGEYVNISKVTVNNEMERDILREAISEFINQDKAVTKTTYCEGELVVVISDDCRLPRGTVCAVMYITEQGATSYYIRNVDSDYCCWAREDQIKGVI